MTLKQTRSSRSSRGLSRAATPVSNAAAASATAGYGFVAIITLLYLLLAAAYNHVIPFRSDSQAAPLIQSFQLPVNSDEAAHFANALVYRSGRIPVFQVGDPNFEAHQPPLYYALIAPTLDTSPTDNEPARAARWLSILLGAATIWVTYAAVRTVFSAQDYLAQGAAAFVGLLPMNVNLDASISNDVLTNLMAALALWQLARIVMRMPSLTARPLAVQSLLLGVLLALGLYTKTSLLASFAAVAAAAWVMARRRITGSRDIARFAAISIGTGLLLAAPWMVRNTRLYGDPVAQHIFQTAFVHTTMTAAHRQERLGSLGAYAWEVVKLSFESFWGVFDGMMVPMPWPVYAALAVFTAAAAGGFVRWHRRAELTWPQQVVLGGYAVLSVVTLAAFIRFNMTFFQAQGRYLFTALVPAAVFTAAGCAGLADKWVRERPNIVPLFITAALVLLNAVSIERLHWLFPGGQ